MADAVRVGTLEAITEGAPVAAGAWSTPRLDHHLHWILRIAVAACFVGHGAFGFPGKPAWLPYFAVVGIGPDAAWTLMPLVGTLDVLCGILVLVLPIRLVFLHLVVWGAWTGMLRPLSGDSIWELVERAGNYGVPLAALVLVGGTLSARSLLSPVAPAPLTRKRADLLVLVLRLTTAALLLGHGMLGAANGKAGLEAHYAAIGLGGVELLGLPLVRVVGLVELGLAVAVMFARRPWLALLVVAWKMATEMLFPISGTPFWEFVERGGSYAAPLALALMLAHRRRRESGGDEPALAAATSRPA